MAEMEEERATAGRALSSRARAHLRSLAHHLDPVVRLGAEGMSEGVIEATNEALEEHELIKVRFGPGYVGDRREGAESLAAATGASLVQVIGRVVVLYRPPSASAGGGSGGAAGPRAPKITLPEAGAQAGGRTTRPPR